jgi:hypothetical protein
MQGMTSVSALRLGGERSPHHPPLGLALTLSIVVVFLSLAPARSAPHLAATPPHPVVAFVNVHVIPMDRERVLQGQTVIVRDGKIAELGPARTLAVPKGAVRVEGRGRYLMPGLSAHPPAVYR